MTRVFMAMPTYDLTCHVLAARAFYATPSRRLPMYHQEGQRSLLANGFNVLWTTALNARRQDNDVTHFAMLHSDVVPQDGWLDVLYEEMDVLGLDLLSVVMPIKTLEGLTSTAIDRADGGWQPERRLTLREVHRLPETFTAEDCGYEGRALLVNTGCWLADLRNPIFEKCAFRVLDDVQEVSVPDPQRLSGTQEMLAPACVSEDWDFSRQVHKLGGRVAATRKVACKHVGPFLYDNQRVYGLETDRLAGAEEQLPVFKGAGLARSKEGAVA